MIYIFDWLGDFIGGIGSAIGGVFDFLGEQISNAIWNTMLQWFYETIYNAVADFFTMMGNMGADVFDLEWVQATINLFTLFGWALFVAGTVVAVFDVAIEYQNGRANIKTTAINVLKGFFACSLFGIVPVELYKFCISLQNTFSKDLSSIMAGQQSIDLAGQSTSVLEGSFAVSIQTTFGLDSSVKEYTKPLFSIPTHHFLFFPGNINPKNFEDALMVEPNEYALIKFGERGTCLYRCGNERYLLLVQAPEYKAEIFGSAGGR